MDDSEWFQLRALEQEAHDLGRAVDAFVERFDSDAHEQVDLVAAYCHPDPVVVVRCGGRGGKCGTIIAEVFGPPKGGRGPFVMAVRMNGKDLQAPMQTGTESLPIDPCPDHMPMSGPVAMPVGELRLAALIAKARKVQAQRLHTGKWRKPATFPWVPWEPSA